MRHSTHYHKLYEEWKKKYEDLGPDPSTYKAFQNFMNVYKQFGGAKTSEHYFKLVLCHILQEQTKLFILESQWKVDVQLTEDIVKKCQIDMYITTTNGNFLFELKKNIDNIEKDLFKWFLLTKKPLRKHEKIQLVWEEEDKSMDRNQQPNQYKQLLEYAKRERWINDYFYFTPSNFSNEINRLKRFLSNIS